MIKQKAKLNRGPSAQAGMTYVELIVVLSIFAVLSTVVIFNYSAFQSKVDLKNLASDIALQIVQAQKSSLSGLLPLSTQSHGAAWKPSYGVYFNTNGTVMGADNTHFIYFVDLNNTSKLFDGSTCPTATGECLSQYTITKKNSIPAKNSIIPTNGGLSVVYIGGASTALDDLTITFTRPDSSATLYSGGVILPNATNISYVQITVHPQKGNDTYIRLYLPGRIEID